MEPYTHYCIHYIHTPWRIIDFTLSELGNDHSYITEIKPNQRYENTVPRNFDSSCSCYYSNPRYNYD